jgi:hypothetical protein
MYSESGRRMSPGLTVHDTPLSVADDTCCLRVRDGNVEEPSGFEYEPRIGLSPWAWQNLFLKAWG